MKKILIVDDDVAVTNFLLVFLMQTGLFEVIVANDSREVADLVEANTFNLVLLDMDMPHLSGMDIMRALKKAGHDIPVIILTGVSDVDLAVKAMKLGAFDYLTKPVEEEHLLEVIDAAIAHSALHESISELPKAPTRENLSQPAVFASFPTVDPAMIRIFHHAEKVAHSELSVFIWGERGTGKELLARAIHKVSPLSSGPFIAINAAGQDPDNFPAALFGQARNYGGEKEESCGFLGEAAEGTIYIDEVEHLSMPVQVRLKRVIQTGEYYQESSTQIREAKVRFIVATDCDLTSEEYKSTFSRDLLYHLMVNSIQLPPLRDRVGDIPKLAETFMQDEVKKTGRQVKGMAPEFLELILQYEFPDNIQELRTIMCVSVANAEGDQLTVDAIPPYIRDQIGAGHTAERRAFKPLTMAEMEIQHARKTVEYFGSDLAKAAKSLAITPEKLSGLLKSK